jgi:acyl CoA:acetate/3-ketoacid CoA transferase beta subunit
MQEWAELGPLSDRGDATENERHAILAARVLLKRFRTSDIDCILAGLGISSLAAWMGAMRLLEEGRHVPLMVEAGMYGYVPAPADPFLFNFRNMSRGLMLADTLTTLGVMTGGARNRAIGVLGAAQIDREGQLNTTRLPGLLLTGSGGANDIGSAASEVLVTIAHSPRRLVDKVDFVTTPGRAVRTIVTPLGVMERGEDGFRLTAGMARDGKSIAELVDAARAATGWPLAIADDVTLEPEPSTDEVTFARQLDPRGLFLG